MLGSEQLYEPRAVRKVRDLFQKLVDEEAPVTLESALRRVGEAWGLGRVGSRARVRLLEIQRTCGAHLRETAGVESIWRDAGQAESWRGYRPNSGPDQRAIGEVPVEELLGAVVEALDINISLTREDLVRETARLLGFQRVGRVVQERVVVALDHALAINLAEETDGWIRHPRASQ